MFTEKLGVDIPRSEIDNAFLVGKPGGVKTVILKFHSSSQGIPLCKSVSN